MKKIVIVTNKMVMGGIEKSLISMLNVIDNTKYKVTVLLMELGGDMINEIPPWVDVKLVPSITNNILKKVVDALKCKDIIKGLKIIYYSIFTKLTNKSYLAAYHYSNILNNLEGEYDLAISYHTPLGFPVGYVINNINAKKKIAYIHGDMDLYKNIDYFEDIISKYKNYYTKYNEIFCVSKDARKKFIKYYPTFKDKVNLFYNIINQEDILKKSNEKISFDDEFNGVRIVTVGRLSLEKGQLIIPNIVNRLIKDGINIKWYLIGDGNLRYELSNKIEELGIQNELILLGTQKNPYAFIRNCDIYVQTSEYEGYCITLAEAKLLNKPIITTNFVGAREQIINGVNGILVNYSTDEIYESLKILINDISIRLKFEEKLKESKDNSRSEINKIYKILEC